MRAVARVPTLAMLAAPLEELRARAERLRELAGAGGPRTVSSRRTVPAPAPAPCRSPTCPASAVALDRAGGDADALAARLRAASRPSWAASTRDGCSRRAQPSRDEEVEELAAAVRAALA